MPKEVKLKNGQILTIREAEKEDAGRALDYLEEISAETDYLTFGPGEYGMSVEQQKEFIAGFANSANKLLLLTEIDEKIVGSLGFAGGERKRIEHTGELGCAVVKKCWGLGIGTELVETLLEWAKSTGKIRKINLKVRPDNTRAINLYKRLGFRQEGILSREQFTKGRFYDCIIMGLHID